MKDMITYLKGFKEVKLVYYPYLVSTRLVVR